MAMFSTGLRTGMLDNTGARTALALGFLRIFSGAVPASADDAETGTLLSELSNNGTVTGLTSADGGKTWTGTFTPTPGYTGDASVTYSIPSTSFGLAISIASTGVYTVTGLIPNSGSATLRAVYGGVTIDKVYSIAKSMAGFAAKSWPLSLA